MSRSGLPMEMSFLESYKNAYKNKSTKLKSIEKYQNEMYTKIKKMARLLNK